MFIEKERKLKQDLAKKEKERVEIIYKVMMLILETNLAIIKMTDYPDNTNINRNMFEQSEKLKESFETISKDLNELNKEYEMIMNLTTELHRESSSHH